jgi:hypothetical protein
MLGLLSSRFQSLGPSLGLCQTATLVLPGKWAETLQSRRQGATHRDAVVAIGLGARTADELYSSGSETAAGVGAEAAAGEGAAVATTGGGVSGAGGMPGRTLMIRKRSTPSAIPRL